MRKSTRIRLAAPFLTAIFGALCGAIFAALAGAAISAERQSLDWLRYDRGAAGYEIDKDLGDPARHEASPAWAEGEDLGAPDHVMLIIPKRSVDAYSTSVDTILGAFHERRRAARFSIWYYAGDPGIAEEALAWAEDADVDLIMTVGSDATALIHEIYRGPDLIPVVTSASKDPVLMGQTPTYDAGSGDNIAYTSINLKVETLIPLLRQVFPDLSDIWVLYAERNVSAIETQLQPLIDYAAANPEQGLRIGEISVANHERAPADLARKMPDVIAKIEAEDPERRRTVFWITGSTSVYDHIGLINQLAEGAPVLAALPDVVRAGSESAILSIGVNQSSAVHLAALYALRILAGEAKASDLPVGQVSPPDIAINFLKVEEIGLTLPFSFFEDATFIYDRTGAPARAFGQRIRSN